MGQDTEGKEKLYYVSAKRFINVDPVRGYDSNSTEYRERVVVAECEEDADVKCCSSLINEGRAKNWKNSTIKELVAGQDISLEKRLEILSEVFKVVR